MHARAREPVAPLVLRAEAVVLLRPEPAERRDAGRARVALRLERPLDRRGRRGDPHAPRPLPRRAARQAAGGLQRRACCARPARRSRARRGSGSATCPARCSSIRRTSRAGTTARGWTRRACTAAGISPTRSLRVAERDRRRTTPARPRPAPQALAAAIAHVGKPALVAGHARRAAGASPTSRAGRRAERRRLPRAAPERAADPRRDLPRLPGVLTMADCCDDFTRSHLLRASVAKAGSGLPIVEPGMPIPAGTGLTRRSVLLRSAGLALAVYGAGKTRRAAGLRGRRRGGRGRAPACSCRSSWTAAPTRSACSRPSTTRATSRCARRCGCCPAPARRSRPTPGCSGIPSAQGLRELWDDAGVGVAVAPAIGYASPNQSHFTSRHFWEVGATDPNATTGWLGRYLDRVGSLNVPIQGLSLDGSLSPQLATSSVAVAATNNISDYQFQARGVWGTMQTRMRATLRPARRRELGRPDPRAGPPGAVQRRGAVERPRDGRQPARRPRARTTRRRTAASRRACRPSRACSARRTAPATTCPCAA